MKKLLLILAPLILLLAAGAWVGLTFAAGATAEAAFTNDPDALPEEVSRYLAIHHEPFEKGFRSSKARTHLALAGAETDDEGVPEEALILNTDIYHGPLAFTPDGTIPCSHYAVTTIDMETFPEEIREDVNKMFRDQPPVTIRTTATVGGTVTSAVAIAPMTLENEEENGTAEFDGLEITTVAKGVDGESFEEATVTIIGGAWRLHADDIEIEAQPANGAFDIEAEGGARGQFTLGKVSGTGETGAFGVESIAFTTDQESASEGSPLMVGEGRVELKGLTIPVEGETFTLENVRVETLAESENGQFAGSATYALDKPSLPAKMLGEAAPFQAAFEKGVSLTLGGSGFDLPALEAVQEKAMEMQLAQFDSLMKIATADDPDPAAMAAVAESPEYQEAMVDYMNGALDLVAPGVELATRLEILGAQGTSEADLKLRLGGESPLRELGTLREIIAALSGELSVSVDKRDLPQEMVGMMAMQLTASGFLKDEENTLTGEARLADGVLSINDKPTPFIEAMGPALDQPIPWEMITNPMGK